MDLAEKLMVLADAATDGGPALVRALRTVLAETAPFDAGEAVLAEEGALLRWRLDDGPPGEILGADLVRHIGALHAPLRLDDLDDVSPYPETRRAMEALGLRSVLVLPFQGGGALAVARRYGWAFVGASLHHLWPVRGMAGIGLRQAVIRQRLEQKVAALEAELGKRKS
jgi:hypothetical protein